MVGCCKVGSGTDSQAGFTLLSSEPVVVDDLRTETRFSGPSLLRDHGVVSGVSVILHGPTRPFGVLGIHTRKRRSFSSDDVNFLQAVANVLAESVRRELAEQERAHLEEQLRHSQKMEAAGTLATGVAHDFGNLTMAIVGYVDLARSFAADNRDVIKALDGIDKAARQATDITKSLLTFSKRAAVERSSVDLGQLILESVEMLRHMLPASVQIVTDIATPSDLWIEADATQIQQVLMNLVLNARDAMPEGGRLKISLRRRMANAPGGLSGVPAFEEGTAVLIVEDTGTGMSADVQQRVFEPFFTTKTRDRGTGLGMAVVHGIITQHHGTIGIESSPGEGTCITVAFPCCTVPGSSELGQQQDPNRSKPAAKPGSGQTVMLAEKDRAVRAILMTSLRKAGYQVIEASDGIEAMRLLANPEAGVRLALLDADLPGKNGLACLQEICQRRPRLPVVLMTSSSEVVLEPHYTDRAIVLQKPFPLAVLTDVVARMMAITEPAGK